MTYLKTLTRLPGNKLLFTKPVKTFNTFFLQQKKDKKSIVV